MYITTKEISFCIYPFFFFFFPFKLTREKELISPGTTGRL
jgi:hypothetical protein